MRIFHFSDTHIDPTNHFNTKPALIYCAKKIVEEKPDLVVIPGDLFDTRGRIDPTSLWIWRSVVSEIQRVCPIVTIPGNHDAANEYRSVDSVTAALDSFGLENYTAGAYPIHVFNVPGVYEIKTRSGELLQIAAMPAPSKFHYQAALANQPDDTTIDEAICDVLRGLAADSRCRQKPTILVYHGSVKGGTFDNGRVAGEGMGVEIPRNLFEGPWLAVLAGDLHSFQTVGRVVYSGAIAPLNYNLQGYQPVILDWHVRTDGRPSLFEPIEIPVEHQLLTVDVGPEDIERAGDERTPTAIVGDKLSALSGAGDLDGAIVRVRLKLPEHRVAEWDEEMIRGFLEVHEWKFQIERIPAVRIRGEDVSVDTAIDALMWEWIGLNPELQKIDEQLVKFAEEIDSKLPPAAFLGTTGAHYRPIKAEATNWMQYVHAEIPFGALRQLNCLNGPNMAGKSNAARIEPMALYGKKALNNGMALRDVVRIGSRETTVNLEFETGSTDASRERWRIERTVRLSPTGTASGGLNLMCWSSSGDGDGGWVSANGADAPATQAKINELVGPPEVFFRTRFARQGDVDAILDMKPSELKDTITESLNAQIFDKRKAAAKEQLSGISTRITELEGRLQGLRETIGDDEMIVEQMKELGGRHQAAKKNIECFQEGLEQISGRLDELAKEIREIEVEKKRWAEWEERRKAFIGKKLKIEKRLQDAGSVVANEQMITEKLERTRELREDVDQAGKRLLLKTQLDSDLTKVESKLGENVREYERSVKTLEDEIQRLERKAKLREEVPCQDPENFDNSPGAQTFNSPDDFKGCQFLVEAVAASVQIPDEKAELAELKANKNELNKLELKQRQTIQDQIEEVGYDQDRHREIQKELGSLQSEGWDKLAEKIAEARGSITQLEKQLKDSIGDIEITTAERDSHQVDEAKYVELSTLTVEIKDLQKSRKTDLDKYTARDRELGQEIAKLQGRLETIQKAKTSIEQTETRLTALRAQSSIGDAYLVAVSRDGIPFLLLERAIPSLQNSVNDILTETPVAIEIEPLRELASGKIAEGVSIRYSDANGVFPLPTASGFQRMILGMALRAGVAELEQLATGFRIELVYIDEGFGAFDGTNLEAAHDVLRRIARRFEKVIYITHIDQLKSIADTSIRVIPSAEGSRIEVA